MTIHEIYNDFVAATRWDELYEKWGDMFEENMIELALHLAYSNDLNERPDVTTKLLPNNLPSDRDWKIATHWYDIVAWANGEMSAEHLAADMGYTHTTNFYANLAYWRETSLWDIPYSQHNANRGKDNLSAVYAALVEYKQTYQGNSPTMAELSSTTGLSVSNVYRMIKELEESKRITIIGPGSYVLNEYDIAWSEKR